MENETLQTNQTVGPKQPKKFNLKEFVSKNKGLAIAICAIIVLIVVAVVLFLIKPAVDNNGTAAKGNNGITANTNEGIVKDETFEGLKFTNVTLIRDEKAAQYTLTADVTNTTNETLNTTQVDIVLKNESGNEIITLLGYIGEDLKANETRTVTASTSDSIDLSQATVKEIKAHTTE